MAGYYTHPMFREGAPLTEGVEFFEDFLKGPAASATDDLASFDLVGTNAALTFSDTAQNGVGILVSNSTNPAFLIGNGEPFKLEAAKYQVFEARVNLADADGMSFFAGLAITNANPFSGSLTDYVGFFATDGSIKYGCGKNNNNVPGSGTSGNETDADSGVDFVDATNVTLQVAINGITEARFYVDGVLVGKVTSNLPDDELLTTHVGMVGSGETISVDYVKVIAPRA